MSKRRWTDEQFVAAVAKASNGLEAIQALGLRPLGGNYRTLYKHIERLGLSTTHWNRRRVVPPNTPQALSEVLVEDSTFSRWSLRRRLVKEGLLEYRCAICGICEWTGHKLSLHLDHINGVNTDNRLENLRFLCPNCHSLTPTYSRGNRRKYNPPNRRRADCICASCGIQISRQATHCRSCAGFIHTEPKIDWPPLDKLIDMLSRMSYVAVGKELGVSDSAVRKHIRRHRKRWYKSS